MRHWAGRILVGVVILLATAAIVGASYQAISTTRELASTPPPGKLVDVGGYRLHIWCTGTGTPAVILDSGLGGTALDWGAVQPDIAKFTQVCSYDRAGMGYSDAGPKPRTSQQIVRELATLLDRTGVTGRVILVGASVAGWNVRLFASNFEDRVAGLVLLDARHEDQGERLAAAGARENPPWVAWVAQIAPFAAYLGIPRVLGIAPGPADSVTPPLRRFAQATRFRASAFVATASEMLDSTESTAQVKAARRELTIPLVVVSAGRRGRNARVNEVLDSLQRDQVGLSKRGCQVIAERSGHAITVGQPEIVVEAIRTVVKASREAGGPPDCQSIAQDQS